MSGFTWEQLRNMSGKPKLLEQYLLKTEEEENNFIRIRINMHNGKWEKLLKAEWVGANSYLVICAKCGVYILVTKDGAVAKIKNLKSEGYEGDWDGHTDIPYCWECISKMDWDEGDE